MKPILIRTNDSNTSKSIVKHFKDIMRKRSGIESIATIDVMKSSTADGFCLLNKIILMNDHLILKNIDPFNLFVRNEPFYEKKSYSDQLILCSVIDSNVKNPIFPKGFYTINIDEILPLLDKYHTNQLTHNYAQIAYLTHSIHLLSSQKDKYTFDEIIHIERIYNDKIKQVDRRIHHLLSKHKRSTQVYKSAV